MPPSEQERRCGEAVCRYLRETSGDGWRIEGWPDDRHADKPSPDVVLTDGTGWLVMEIKQLTDGETFHTAHWQGVSLVHQLSSIHGQGNGEFALFPPTSTNWKFDSKLISECKIAIAEVAPNLKAGESAPIEIPRRATIQFCGEADIGVVHCSHTYDDFMPVNVRGLNGVYYLKDSGPKHKFITEASRAEFCREIERAGQVSRVASESPLRWSEEWELRKLRDLPEGSVQVWVVGMMVTAFLEAAATEGVHKGIEDGKKKFMGLKERPNRLAVALHAGEQQWEVPPGCFRDAISRLDAAAVRPLDTVFLVARDRVWRFDFTP